jgi:ABC-type thiamine transport system substrate-binding protein
MDVWGAAICYNLAEAAKLGLPRIESWKDLLKPEFKGKVVMPNPNSSGTGFLDVTAWLQIFGEKGGWEYMDQAAPERGRVHPLGLQALRDGRLPASSRSASPSSTAPTPCAARARRST